LCQLGKVDCVPLVLQKVVIKVEDSAVAEIAPVTLLVVISDLCCYHHQLAHLFRKCRFGLLVWIGKSVVDAEDFNQTLIRPYPSRLKVWIGLSVLLEFDDVCTLFCILKLLITATRSGYIDETLVKCGLEGMLRV
jgi:hypothetical protein